MAARPQRFFHALRKFGFHAKLRFRKPLMMKPWRVHRRLRFMPSRIQLITLSSAPEIIVGRPREPVQAELAVAQQDLGVMELSDGPGSDALASDCIRP